MKYPPIPEKHVPRAIDFTRALIAANWSDDEIAGFLAAQAMHGILRENTPAWLDQTTDFLLKHGRIHFDDALQGAHSFVWDCARAAPEK